MIPEDRAGRVYLAKGYRPGGIPDRPGAFLALLIQPSGHVEAEHALEASSLVEEKVRFLFEYQKQ